MTHALKRIDEERDSDGRTRWRWVCSCATSTGRNRKGQWTYQSDNAAREAWRRHELRSRPRPTGPKGLRNLLRLEF